MSPIRPVLLAAGALGVGALAFVLVNETNASKAAANQEQIARGRYLVHDLAMCIDCHSPRGERGEFIEGKHLSGSPLGFAPTVPMPAWADVAPAIAGLPNYTDEQAVHFLMTTERPNGQPPARPPMPHYRMSAADAGAVVAYLRSVAP